MANSSLLAIIPESREGPAQSDLDKCVHCGLCLNACPTYRELALEMDSPRGRIYQMNQVANGAPITPSYIQHLGLCLACRGCESACPSGVPYGRMIEAARAQIQSQQPRSVFSSLVRRLIFERLIPSAVGLQIAGAAVYLYQASGLQHVARATGIFKPFGNLADLEALLPNVEPPFFYCKIGQSFPAMGKRRYRVAFLAGCVANIAFARLNEATVRVLQRNGCEVVIPPAQSCCGALHVHSGLVSEARKLARKNIDSVLNIDCDAIVTNAAGCGSTLKEYNELLEHDSVYREKAIRFTSRLKDITEFLASIDFNRDMGRLELTATYQDSCHLAHGQKIKDAPRKLLKAIPGLIFQEMPMADLCCGSAGTYNIAHNALAMQILRRKMDYVTKTKASVIATANPGCMLQLAAGARMYGSGQRVAHVVELMDEAYRKFDSSSGA